MENDIIQKRDYLQYVILNKFKEEISKLGLENDFEYALTVIGQLDVKYTAHMRCVYDWDTEKESLVMLDDIDDDFKFQPFYVIREFVDNIDKGILTKITIDDLFENRSIYKEG